MRMRRIGRRREWSRAMGAREEEGEFSDGRVELSSEPVVRLQQIETDQFDWLKEEEEIGGIE